MRQFMTRYSYVVVLLLYYVFLLRRIKLLHEYIIFRVDIVLLHFGGTTLLHTICPLHGAVDIRRRYKFMTFGLSTSLQVKGISMQLLIFISQLCHYFLLRIPIKRMTNRTAMTKMNVCILLCYMIQLFYTYVATQFVSYYPISSLIAWTLIQYKDVILQV